MTIAKHYISIYVLEMIMRTLNIQGFELTMYTSRYTTGDFVDAGSVAAEDPAPRNVQLGS